MKDIKFRVWLNGLKNMCEVKSIHFDIGIVYAKHEEHHNGYDKSRSEVYDIVGCHTVPVMQYTGLKDKNGKEIYEGDIVLIDDSFFIVKYFNAGFCLFKSNKDEAWRLEDWEDLRAYAWCCEIYGNVYENKDLLND